MPEPSDIPDPEIDRLLREADPEPPQQTGRTTLSVVFFDLVGSTARKLTDGHKAGVTAAVKHNNFCRLIVEHYEGEVLKDLGDGILGIFEDPLNAVLAANAARNGLVGTELSTKVGLTTGMVDVVKVEGRKDVLGAVVDRAARIQAVALPDQVLVDRSQVDAISDFMRDHREIWLGTMAPVHLKGAGNYELWPIESQATEGHLPRLPERLRVYGAGRISTPEKLRFMNYAEREVIEFGTGLMTFVHYFENLSSAAWREPVQELLNRGVNIHCFALDGESQAARAYFKLRGEEKYRILSVDVLAQLRSIRDELNEQSTGGKVQISTYRSLPSHYVLAVDLGSDRSGMQFSPYLPSTRRAECPVFEVSRVAEPELFKRMQASLEQQIAEATPVF